MSPMESTFQDLSNTKVHHNLPLSYTDIQFREVLKLTLTPFLTGSQEYLIGFSVPKL